MQETSATDALLVLGIEDVIYREQESLEEEGRVLKQLPTAGTEVLGGPVTLTYAVPLPPMPDLVGRRFGDAQSQLLDWGVSVIKEVELSTERPDGEVISTTPAIGDKVGAEVLLVVAAAPVYGALDTEDAPLVEEGDEGANFYQYVARPEEVAGDLYEKSLIASLDSRNVTAGDLAYWEFNLGKDWQQFLATVGIADGSEFEQSARFRVILDGNLIWEEDNVRFGTAVPIEIDISGGLRLRLEAVALDQGRISMVWGSPRLIGVEGSVVTSDSDS
jgi:serine/threonine-protein kinase